MNFYNDKIYNTSLNIRDYILFHYLFTNRNDSSFWRYISNDVRIPERVYHMTKNVIKGMDDHLIDIHEPINFGTEVPFTVNSWVYAIVGYNFEKMKNKYA